MRAMLAPALLWTSAIGCGLMAGVYFAFSAFIMTSLGRIAPASGMVAMNATIVDIVKSPFMPVFMLTTLTAASLAVLGVVRWGQPGSALTGDRRRHLCARHVWRDHDGQPADERGACGR